MNLGTGRNGNAIPKTEQEVKDGAAPLARGLDALDEFGDDPKTETRCVFCGERAAVAGFSMARNEDVGFCMPCAYIRLPQLYALGVISEPAAENPEILDRNVAHSVASFWEATAKGLAMLARRKNARGTRPISWPEPIFGPLTDREAFGTTEVARKM